MAIPIRNSRIKLSQGQIFWREVGQLGPVLIFLHGSWSDSSQWIPVFERLSGDYHCFAPDLLGFGDSERRRVRYSIDLEVECLAEFLETLNQKQVYLIGHSLGAWIAASFALKYPEQVKGVVLLAPEGLPAKAARTSRWGTRWLLGRPPLFIWFLRSLLPLFKLLRREEKIKRTLQYRQKLLKSPTASKLFFLRSWSQMKAEFLQEKLESMKAPVLILQGGQDALSAISQSKTYAELTPTAEMHVIGLGDNDLPQKFPDEVTQYIIDFIDSVEQSPT